MQRREFKSQGDHVFIAPVQYGPGWFAQKVSLSHTGLEPLDHDSSEVAKLNYLLSCLAPCLHKSFQISHGKPGLRGSNRTISWLRTTKITN